MEQKQCNVTRQVEDCEIERSIEKGQTKLERHVEMVGVKDREEDGAETLHTCEL